MSESNKPSEAERVSSELPRGSSRVRSESPETSTSEAPTSVAYRPAKTRPRLFPLAVVTLIGLGAVVWLAFAVMESVISRSAKRAEIDALSERLGTLRTDVSKTEVERDGLRATRDELQRNVDGLRARRESLAGDVTEAHAVIERASLARGRQAELDRALAEDRRKLEELEREHKQLASEVASGRQRRDDLKAANDAEADRLKVMRNDLQTLRAERERVEQERVAAHGELAGARVKVEGALQRLKAVLEDISNGRNDLGALEKQRDVLRTQAEAASRDAGREVAALDALRRQRDTLGGEVAHLEARKSNLEQETAGLLRDRDAVSEVRVDLNAVRAEADSTHGRLDRLKASLIAMRAEEKKLSGRVRALTAQQSRLEPAREGLAATEQAAANAAQELDAINRDLAEARPKADRARTLAALLPALKAETQAMETRRDTVAKAIADLEGQRAERDRLVVEASAAQGRLNGLVKDEEELRALTTSLEARRVAAKEAMVGLQEARTAAQTEHATLQAQIKDAQRRLSALSAVKQERETGKPEFQTSQPDPEAD